MFVEIILEKYSGMVGGRMFVEIILEKYSGMVELWRES